MGVEFGGWRVARLAEAEEGIAPDPALVAAGDLRPREVPRAEPAPQLTRQVDHLRRARGGGNGEWRQADEPGRVIIVEGRQGSGSWRAASDFYGEGVCSRVR